MADRCITEVFEMDEAKRAVRRGAINSGLIVEHTHEDITSTRVTTSRNIFKFLLLDAAKAKGLQGMPVTEKMPLSVRGLDLPAEPSGLAMLEPSQLIPSVAGREPSAREVIELHQSFECLLITFELITDV